MRSQDPSSGFKGLKFHNPNALEAHVTEQGPTHPLLTTLCNPCTCRISNPFSAHPPHKKHQSVWFHLFYAWCQLCIVFIPKRFYRQPKTSKSVRIVSQAVKLRKLSE